MVVVVVDGCGIVAVVVAATGVVGAIDVVGGTFVVKSIIFIENRSV